MRILPASNNACECLVCALAYRHSLFAWKIVNCSFWENVDGGRGREKRLLFSAITACYAVGGQYFPPMDTLLPELFECHPGMNLFKLNSMTTDCVIQKGLKLLPWRNLSLIGIYILVKDEMRSSTLTNSSVNLVIP